VNEEFTGKNVLYNFSARLNIDFAAGGRKLLIYQLILTGSRGKEMGVLNWLHLSDWHQGNTKFDRTVVCDRLIDDIRNRTRTIIVKNQTL
jgi:hypothetical protein